LTQVFELERKLSDLVNESYGLPPEEVDLMRRTAPPRMPFSATGLQPLGVPDVAEASDD